MNRTAESIERGLREVGTEERAEGEKAYLKSELHHFGVSVKEIRRVVRNELKALDGLDRAALLALVNALWERRVAKVPVHELRSAAVEALDFRGRGLLQADDMKRLEELLRECRTWALVDPLAVHVVGALVTRFAELGATLDRWATDEDFWIRRSAMLALLRPLRTGEGDFERFARYADAMIEEKEFFIRKAIGWVLREAGKKRPERVDAFIAPRTHRASGVTMREAVKVLGEARAAELMAAYKSKRPAVGSAEGT